MEMEAVGQAVTTPYQGARYNGKELEQVTGVYAYGFRHYDPTIGRFTGADPIADQFAWVSVFNYAENSPIANIDLWGLQAVFAGDGSNIIVGYRVPKGYGVTQLAADINTNYGCNFSCEIQSQDIMYNNLQYFPEKNTFGSYPGALTDRDDFSDPEHSQLNMNEMDYIDLTFTLELQPEYTRLVKQYGGNQKAIESLKEKLRPLDSTLSERQHDVELWTAPPAIKLPRDEDKFHNGEAGADLAWKIRNMIQQERLRKQIAPLQKQVDSLNKVNDDLPKIIKQ